MVSETLGILNLMALLTMSKNLLPMAKSDPKLLMGLMEKLAPYQFWPSPVGNTVQELIEDLRCELCAPGVSYLSNILREYNDPNLVLNQKEKYRLIYYFVDSTNTDCKRKKGIMCMVNDFDDLANDQKKVDNSAGKSPEKQGESTTDKRQCKLEHGLSSNEAANLIAAVLRLQGGLSEIELNALRGLNENEVRDYLNSIITIFQKCTSKGDWQRSATENKNNVDLSSIRTKLKNTNKRSQLNDIKDEFRLPPYKHISLLISGRIKFPTQIQIVEKQNYFHQRNR
eukprot:UN06893